MIKVENLSYGVPAKELYKDISFTVEAGSHCVLIGSNGTGKSTLVDMIMDTEKYLYDGKIIKAPECRMGYASQFSVRDKNQERTVFEFLAQRFVENQAEIAAVCEEMVTAEDMDEVFGRYQALLDLNEAMDGDNYESNIHKQLFVAGMTDLAETQVSQISGGEYKILQIMREMLLAPNLLILDEPDVFLDFGNLNSLCQLINNYKGTILVVTHNRYLLNHCFNKI
ncbi:MAG: ABC-F family ATP-binding cassette domain-containing protein, partial [Firmicutes bacterium]|nr:ABC-F family ATP-binding cassette domain-containing protein [Bacillota bacterium]